MLTSAQMLGLQQSHLVQCQGQHLLMQEAASAFARMQTDAKQRGIDIQIVSSYRSFDRQLLIWNQKWQGERPVYSLDNALMDTGKLTNEQKLHAILTWSALPGASRHHWGTDLDVFDKTAVQQVQHKFELISAEYKENGPCYALACWLAEHAESYGFYRPYNEYTGGVAAEPWHLSYRPIAEKIIAQLDFSCLQKKIESADMAGKDMVLAQLPALFKRYTLNKGQVE